MWNKLVRWFKKLLFGVSEPQPEVIPEYNLPTEWTFDGDEVPTNEVVHKFNQGLETVGEHIVYRSQDTGKFAGSLVVNGHRWQVKEITLWISGAKLLPGHQYLSTRSTCGVQRCVRPDHLHIKYAPSKKQKAPPKSQQPKLNVNKVQGPPEYIPPAKPKLTGKSKEELLSGDRTLCVSAKVFYPTLIEVQAVAAYYNNHYRPSGQPRLYGYECDWCAGSHLTHQNPKKRPVYKHKGSWA